MSTAEIEDETPNQRAARLRREKRQAKAAGEERLNKIKALNGGIAPPEEVLNGTETAADPEEVDLSSAYGTANVNTSFSGARLDGFGPSFGTVDGRISEAELQRRLNTARQQQSGTDHQADPTTQAFQNLMSAMGGDKDSIHNTEDPMEMLSKLLNNASSGSAPPVQQSTQSTYLWKLTHAIFALILAGYIAATTPFDGTLLSRTQSTFTEGVEAGLGSRLFLIFITAELGLQSARFYLEGGRLQGSGMLATVSNMAPEPWGSYVRTAGRWFAILSSIFSDAMVVVFVLGVMAWWRGSSGVS